MNILAIVISINIILFLFYFFSKKFLQPAEIIFLWFVSTLLTQTASLILSLNLGMWKLSTKPELFAVLAVNRFLLIPVLIIWFWDLAHSRKRGWLKIVNVIVLCFILTGIEYVITITKAVTYVNWNLVQTFALWVLVVTACCLSVTLFQKKILRRD